MLPFLTIIIPCYNEEATVAATLEAIYKQTYPRANIEVVIADGLSRDRTREVINSFQKSHLDLSICVVDNPGGTIPSALNQAIRQARGEVIIRLDAHSVPYPNYVEQCVSALQAGVGDNVGGVWEIHPGARTWIAESISLAAAHPMGVGDALYRLKPQAGAVDTVPFGSFRRTLIEKIGAFDESLLTNEDYEFNARVRASGGTVWLDPSIQSVYFARSTLAQLAKQYWRYGFWKWRMLRRYPHTTRWRQALPPLFVLSLIVFFVLSLWVELARYLFLVQSIFYFLALGIVGLKAALDRRNACFLVGLPLAIATMHLAWGSGFLWSIIADLFATRNHG